VSAREAVSLIPDSAPFPPEQRAWLSGFFAALSENGVRDESIGVRDGFAAATAEPAADDGELPWHDPALELPERLELARGRPLRLKLMSAMGQLDCGQCGYLCKSYSEAIAAGADKDLAKCVPGGKATARALKKLLEETPPEAAPPSAAATPAVPASAEAGPSRDRPAKVKLLEARRLNAAGSDKDTRAVVLSLGQSGLDYAPGDSLGIWPANNPDEVELILSILRARGSKAVTLAGETLTAREALTQRANLRTPTAALFALLAEHAQLDFEAQRLAHLAEDDERAAGYGIHDVFDALVKFRSARPPVGAFLQSLDRLQPRLYSIASSPHRHPGEVHLTVGVVRYDLNGRGYLGLGSGFFAEHLKPGRTLPAFVQKSHGFRLPADPATPVIMVGPGTGIAPFRAFLQEREASGTPGRNWLFFGDQHEHADFLYRDELEGWLASGVLTHLSTAFSRDQALKVYVQHRMAENAPQLWRWLGDGACFYVCGDAKRMASDVEHALAGVAMSEGGMQAAAALAWVKQLARDGRYLRDVY
jgi:sulfite reductase (NADPH) flavoprotein alpha-component